MRKTIIAALALGAAAIPAQAGQMDLTPDMRAILESAIAAGNYNCPAVKMAWSKGEDARGVVIKAFCGPQDRDGVFQGLAYRVTLRPDNTLDVEPWS